MKKLIITTLAISTLLTATTVMAGLPSACDIRFMYAQKEISRLNEKVKTLNRKLALATGELQPKDVLPPCKYNEEEGYSYPFPCEGAHLPGDM